MKYTQELVTEKTRTGGCYKSGQHNVLCLTFQGHRTNKDSVLISNNPKIPHKGPEFVATEQVVAELW